MESKVDKFECKMDMDKLVEMNVISMEFPPHGDLSYELESNGTNRTAILIDLEADTDSGYRFTVARLKGKTVIAIFHCCDEMTELYEYLADEYLTEDQQNEFLDYVTFCEERYT